MAMVSGALLLISTASPIFLADDRVVWSMDGMTGGLCVNCKYTKVGNFHILNLKFEAVLILYYALVNLIFNMSVTAAHF